MKAEDVKPNDEIYSLIKGCDFQRYYQSFDKSNPQYQHVLTVRKQTFWIQKMLTIETLKRPCNIGVILKHSVQAYSVYIQSERCPNRYLFTDLLMGYVPAPDCYIEFGRLWGYCDLFVDSYEIFQKYRAGNYQTGFTIKPKLNLQKIFAELSAAGYIESDFSGFLAVFSPLPVLFHRVRWIKQNQRGKNTAKKALIDMLRLMGVPADQITDKKRLEACFADDDGQPLIFTGSNFYNNNDYRHHSEYYPELQKIIG